MTLRGTIDRSFLLLFLVMATITWDVAASGSDAVGGLVMLGLIGGFATAIVAIFKKEWAMVTAPLYAIFEGLLLGAISSMFEMAYHGIADNGFAIARSSTTEAPAMGLPATPSEGPSVSRIGNVIFRQHERHRSTRNP